MRRSRVITMLILTGLLLPSSMTVEAVGAQDNPVAGDATFQMTQQQKFVSGNVASAETQEFLIGVSIKIKGMNIVTVTDANGHYQLQLRTSQDILVFSYIGKKSVETQTNDRARLDIVMENDENTFSDVIIYTGCLTQKKADLTGSVAIANQANIARGNSASAMKGLQGKVVGVQITTNGGNPAESVNIQVRELSSLSGSIEPLVVLDGVPTEGLNLRDINAGGIESIQTLRDAASVSIYGAGTSDGIVLIQTKKGKQGKTMIEYRGNISTNTVVSKPQLMNAEEYSTAEFRIQAYDEKVHGTVMSLPTTYSFVWHRDANGYACLDAATPAKWLTSDKEMASVNTDRVNEVFRTAVSANHQLTISSGNNKSRSLFSLGYFNSQGTQIHILFRKYSIRANSEYSLLQNRLKIGENLVASCLQYRSQSETHWAMISPPIVPVYDKDRSWAGAAGFNNFSNPVRLLKMSKNNVNNYVKVIESASLDLSLWKGLFARAQFGIDYGNAYSRTIDGIRSETGGRSSDGESCVGNNQSHPLNYVWTDTLIYNFTNNQRGLTVLLGQENTRYVQEGFSARREDVYLEDRDFAHIGVTTGKKYSLGSSADEYTYLSYFDKINYVYASKYLASATIRRDSSSLFSTSNRWGTFLTFSLGWRLEDEKFMESAAFVSNLKLRANYGTNGNVQGLPRGYTTTPFIPDYFDTSYPIRENESGHLEPGYRRLWLDNPDLEWETTTQTSLDIDFRFFDQRLMGSLEYYFKKTKDILTQTPYAVAMGEGGKPWINGAGMNNRRIEMELVFRNKQGSAFEYETSANIDTYKTKLTSLPSNIIGKYPGDGMRDFVLDKTPSILYGMVADGISKTQEKIDRHAEQPGGAIGRIRYKDLDGDDVINELYDRTYIGITDPDFFGGLSIDLCHHSFGLSVFFQGVFGNMVDSVWRRENDLWNTSLPKGKDHPVRLLDTWLFDNPGLDIPAVTNQTIGNEDRFSTYYVEDGSYLKLGNIELGYTISHHALQKLFINELRLYADTRNVFTLKESWGDDRYTSFDPEMPGYGYLQPFSLTFGINLKF